MALGLQILLTYSIVCFLKACVILNVKVDIFYIWRQRSLHFQELSTHPKFYHTKVSFLWSTICDIYRNSAIYYGNVSLSTSPGRYDLINWFPGLKGDTMPGYVTSSGHQISISKIKPTITINSVFFFTNLYGVTIH